MAAANVPYIFLLHIGELWWALFLQNLLTISFDGKHLVLLTRRERLWREYIQESVSHCRSRQLQFNVLVHTNQNKFQIKHFRIFYTMLDSSLSHNTYEFQISFPRTQQ